MMGLRDLFRRGTRAEAPAPARSRDPSDDFWFTTSPVRSASGALVSIERARTVPVVRDCLQNLSDTIAGLSGGVFQRTAEDSREKAPDHPVARLLADPNPVTTSFEFIAQMIDDLATGGNFVAELEIDRDTGLIVAMWRLDWSCCQVEVLRDRSRRIVVRETGRPIRTLVEGEFWYVPLPPLRDGTTGRSPILDDGRETIGAAIAVNEYANRFFGNDAMPPFFFRMKDQFEDDASKENFLNAWARWTAGRNRGKPGVLEYDMSVEKLAHSNEEAQFLETRKELALDCARIWNMPPHKVGILDKATFSNIEHQALEYVTDTLGPWLELIERSVGKWLIADPAYYFEFNVASLLRGDIQSRFEAYAVARQWGWLSVNEIRRLENMNGIGRIGDRYIEPLNMVPAGEPQTGRDDRQKAIAFLRESVARNGGRPRLKKVIDNAA